MSICSRRAWQANHVQVACQIIGEKLPRQVFFPVTCLLLRTCRDYRLSSKKVAWIDLIVKWCIFLLSKEFFLWRRNKLTYWLIEGENWLGEAVRMWQMSAAGKKDSSYIYMHKHLFISSFASYLMCNRDGWPWLFLARWVGWLCCETFSLFKDDWKCSFIEICKSLLLLLFFLKLCLLFQFIKSASVCVCSFFTSWSCLIVASVLMHVRHLTSMENNMNEWFFFPFN